MFLGMPALGYMLHYCFFAESLFREQLLRPGLEPGLQGMQVNTLSAQVRKTVCSFAWNVMGTAFPMYQCPILESRISRHLYVSFVQDTHT